ncbi:MAG: N-acetylmuramoyl-L-alanine amidase [Sphingomonas sp.]|uniref:N-acetylmuramoyl-L-alanine amidase n=1 Tax=Sphingomonas sp. TaxID=28214 RepID=UPI000A09C81D|nr:N-acetylmuramoyl-L-alanine amidase [Sphingomonas sp.]MBX9882104.1 N-acetylmuramoyl-L-alanine amidase [Sphingomonas sp.]OQW47659.1 MAG: N-acetylmuramoyl-L-alanine amidase [Proteobacteria bacterium SG_bin6]
MTPLDMPPVIEAPSPNFNERSGPITMIVLHYTGMETAEGAIARLRDPAAKVSSHYVVAEDGVVLRLVDEDKRAWHAGKSHWRDWDDVNAVSIGIEIVNPGHEFGYRPFPDAQIDAVIRLVASIKERYAITRGNIVGHSDVAPARKRDPGELFPWGMLARLRLALPRPTKNLMDPHWTESGFLLALERFGYDVSDPMAAIMAFQRRFRPELIDGEIDAECRMILLALLLPKPQGDD